MGKTFAKVHASTVGRSGGSDKIPQWVRANGGEFSKDINSKVTHLITTKEAFRENVAAGMILPSCVESAASDLDSRIMIHAFVSQCKWPKSSAQSKLPLSTGSKTRCSRLLVDPSLKLLTYWRIS